MPSWLKTTRSYPSKKRKRAFWLSWPISQIVYQHHEKMNGSGYPMGPSGEDILLEALILGIADVVEAMASHRAYRPALGIDTALAKK